MPLLPAPPLADLLLSQLRSMPAGARRTAAQLRAGLPLPESQQAVEQALAELAAQHQVARHQSGKKREHATWSLP